MSQPVAPPKLRGWFHLGATPAVIIASLVLFILSRNSVKFAIALYSITAILLFSVSAIYHRVPWSPAKKKIWRRWDHANINLLIAGSYTPFAVTLLEGRDRTILLSVIWTGALIGVAVRVFWVKRPGRDAKYFGFHELFHIFVLAAWISQYVAICVAVYRSR